MEPSTAYMITKVLEDTSKSAVGMNINGVNYCAKTGTTDYDLDYIKKNNLPKMQLAIVGLQVSMILMQLLYGMDMNIIVKIIT